MTAQKKSLLNFLLTVQDATSKRPIFDHQLFQKSSDFARMRRIIRVGLFVTFCWLLSGDIAGAQQSSAATPKPSATNPVPTPIPLSNIASQGESSSDSLHDIEASLSTDQLTATVEKRLPRLTNEIDLRAAEMGKLLGSSLPLEFLHFMEVTLQRFRGELSAENQRGGDKECSPKDRPDQKRSQRIGRSGDHKRERYRR